MTTRDAALRSLGNGRPVRVMHLVYRLSVGGMEVGVTKLVNSLNAPHIVSSICSTCPADELKQRLRAEVRLFELNRRPGNDLRFVADLCRLLRRERPDVLHTHGWGTLIEGLIAARFAGIHAIVHGEHGTLQTRPIQVAAQRLAWQRVDKLLSVSSKLAERMASEVGFPASRIRVIRNGVDLHRFVPRDPVQAKHALGLAAEDLVIGTVGRLVPVKDHATLLNALRILRDRGVAFSPVIAGNGPLWEPLAQHARSLGLSDVRFLGNCSDIETVFNAFDIFVLSSRSEGLSNTIQEAMASGLPVVATRVGGADELVIENETGLLVPPHDPVAMSAALESLAGDGRTREGLGIAARQRAEQLFGLERMLRNYEDVYHEVVGRSVTTQ